MKRSLRIPQRPAAHLTLEPPVRAGAELEFAAVVRADDGWSERLWFRFPVADEPFLSRRADPFLIALLPTAVRRFSALHVKDEVSPGLLSNLDDYQRVLAAFQGPEVLPVELRAEREAAPWSHARPTCISAFSGGVDSLFTVWRHAVQADRSVSRPLGGALLMHGFDVPLTAGAVFDRVLERCRPIAAGTGLAFHWGRTNLRVLPVWWPDWFGAAVGASLSFFSPRYHGALIASAFDYASLRPDHGSNPIVDPMLGSRDFSLTHDGGAFDRFTKISALATWPVALREMRVCWEAGAEGNCGRCEKCCRTSFMLELAGVSQCAAFPIRPTVETLKRLTIEAYEPLAEMRRLHAIAKARHFDAPWVPVMGRTLARSRRYLLLRGVARSGWVPDNVRASVKGLFKPRAAKA